MQYEGPTWVDILLLILWYIWEIYKYLIVGAVTIFLFCFFIVGGNFHVEIHWHNVIDLWKRITR